MAVGAGIAHFAFVTPIIGRNEVFVTTEPPGATTTEPPAPVTTTEPPVATTTEPPLPVTTTEPPVPTTTEPSVPTTTEPPIFDRFAWERDGDGYRPASTDFTLQSGTGTGISLTNDAYGIKFDAGVSATSGWWYKSLPASQKFDLIMRVHASSEKQNYPQVGIWIGSSSFTKQVALLNDATNDVSAVLSKFSAGSFVLSYIASRPVAPYHWMRVNCDGTTLRWYISIDGKTWSVIWIVTLSDFVVSANQGGFYISAGTNDNYTGRISHFEIVDNT